MKMHCRHYENCRVCIQRNACDQIHPLAKEEMANSSVTPGCTVYHDGCKYVTSCKECVERLVCPDSNAKSYTNSSGNGGETTFIVPERISSIGDGRVHLDKPKFIIPGGEPSDAVGRADMELRARRVDPGTPQNPTPGTEDTYVKPKVATLPEIAKRVHISLEQAWLELGSPNPDIKLLRELVQKAKSSMIPVRGLIDLHEEALAKLEQQAVNNGW